MLNRAAALLCTVVLTLGLLAGAYELGARGGVGPAQAADELPESLEAIEEVYDRVQSDAVEAPADDVLVEGAVEGMLGTLGDQYAEYYTSEEYSALNEQLDGSFVGIGVVIEDTDVGLTIQTVLPGSPAEAAGLVPGERIVSVDGEDVSETPSDLVVDEVRGEAGSRVRLGLDGGPPGPREVEVVRAELDLPNVEARSLDGGIGYVRLQQFSGDSGQQVRDAVQGLVDGGSRALVLDLRGNPGGLLPAAVDVTGVFVEDGEVVKVGANADDSRSLRTDGGAVAPQLPLAVLVDEGSASASEIVAGAVQDLDRGEIVGMSTFGKGSVQTITPLPDGQGVKFTTDRYFTPSGDSIDGVGVQPDRVVEAPEGPDDVQLGAAQEALSAVLAASDAQASG